jgi:F-type H+-transporting ATPase subunit epsilon
MADFALTVSTPERRLVDEPASEANIPGMSGYFGVLPGHAPLLSLLGSGTMTWVSGGQTKILAVMGGFIEVLGDSVRVLADEAKPKEEIDRAQAQERLTKAQKELSEHPDQWEELTEAVQRAQAEVDTAAK